MKNRCRDCAKNRYGIVSGGRRRSTRCPPPGRESGVRQTEVGESVRLDAGAGEQRRLNQDANQTLSERPSSRWPEVHRPRDSAVSCQMRASVLVVRLSEIVLSVSDCRAGQLSGAVRVYCQAVRPGLRYRQNLRAKLAKHISHAWNSRLSALRS